MKIAVNCWVLRNKQLDGIGYFVVNALPLMIKNHPEVTFILLCDKNFKEAYFEFPNVVIRRVFPPYRHPLLYIFYFECILPVLLSIWKPDIFLSMDGFLSLFSRVRQVPVIYDLNFEHYPENIALKNRLYFRFFFHRFARKAARIATISEYSKNDISQTYGIPGGKIDNVSCGIKFSMNGLNEAEKNLVRQKYASGHNYFLFVGSMHPRKNLPRMIKAFEEFKGRTKSELKLLISGVLLWNKSELLNAYEASPYKEDILFAGRLSDEELKKVLCAAQALIFVPLFEGFGLPIVEAFEAGVPVLTSGVTSLPEVGGDAVLYADPFSIESIAAGMEKLYYNRDGLSQHLVSRGNERKKQFTWEGTAVLLWECLARAGDSTQIMQ